MTYDAYQPTDGPTDQPADQHTNGRSVPGTESWTVSAAQSFDVADVRSLVVQLTGGAVDVVADPARHQGVHVEVQEVSSRPLYITLRDGELRVAYDFAGIEGLVDRVRGLRDKDSAVVRLTVPATVPVRAVAVGARVTVTGTRAALSASTVTGAVRTAGTAAPLTVKTVSGPVDVTEHTGDARVSTTSGAVALAGRLGRVSVNTVSSAVSIVSPQTTPLVTAKTVSGAVSVRLGAGTGVNLRARSVSGKVVLDGAQLPGDAQRTTSVDHVDHESGAPAAYLSTSTVSGTVTVSRG
ncbi:DUF4097 family beta strand repeat-containing protein [Oerskovia flava]|uniref:DUF4097 family beta strand repeat-containing protein n=1 Tax=Oerskovia flava TaxID=2986422 RepID=UPI00223F1336|nr:DUF4097 family beta strand repeat-containing protein [Oerskovia sp. JB1-3-2]